MGDVCEQIRGVSYKPEDVHQNLTESSVPLLRANNIFEDSLNYNDLVFVNKNKVSDFQYMKKGDILVCASSGSKNLVGKAACLTENKNITFGAFCKVIRANHIDYDYLKHYFFSPTYRRTISELSRGSNINNIKAENLDELQIPLPPLETQKQIAARLDLCTDTIAKHKKLLELHELLIKSQFVKMFGDPKVNSLKLPTKKFEDVVKLQRGFDLPIQNRNQSGKYFVYGSNGILDKHDEYKVKAPGLVTGRSGTLGKVYYIFEDY